MRDLEHQEQVALFKWANLQSKKHPELELLLAIPNGGHRHIGVARKLKAEGVKAGVPDMFLPVKRGNYGGLWIELKKKKGGRLSENQKWWQERLTKDYMHVVANGFEEAKDAILSYLQNTPMI